MIDDTIVEKPYTDENEIIFWCYDYSKNRSVKGTNVVTALYTSQELSAIAAFEPVLKTDIKIDPETGKEKHKSERAWSDSPHATTSRILAARKSKSARKSHLYRVGLL